MDDCVFCKIVAGKLPAQKVYEDERVLAFLTIEPIREGHTLVIPKEHYPYAEDMPNDVYSHLMLIAKDLKMRLGELFGSPYTGLFISGIDVAHTHVHVFPMWDSKDLTSEKKLSPIPTTTELEATARKITEARLNGE